MNTASTNPAQERAICHVSGPMEVLAGPGSGKTYTIVQRIMRLIEEKNVPPEKILVITFTKAAALEMQARFLREIRRSYSAVNFGTFHSIYYQIITRSGYLPDYTLISEQEKKKILRSILNHFHPGRVFSQTEYTEILSEISLRKNMEATHNVYDKFDDIYEEYCGMLSDIRKIDFDDMILSCHEMLNANEKIRKTWQQYFSQVLVDEFQDINRLQYLVLKQIVAPKNNLFIVGDDDQSIYGFRGAAPAMMQEFLADFAGCGQVLLATNYRSSRQIVAAASAVIAVNEKRFPKDYQALRDGPEPQIISFAKRDAEDEWILDEVAKVAPVAHADMAIILRTNHELKAMAAKCECRGIRVQNAEKAPDIFAHFCAQDMLDYIHFSLGPKERSRFLNIINKPMRYLSRKCVAGLTGEVTLDAVLDYYRGGEQGDNADALAEVRRFFAACRRIEGLAPHLAINYIRKGIGYDRYLKERGRPQEFNEWMGICDLLQESAEGMASYEEWFEVMAGLRGQTDEAPAQQKNSAAAGLNIITMHGAKGLEYKTVFLPHLNEGVLPGARSLTADQIEEERRLFYVGMTRAKETLYLTYTESLKLSPSRFLLPIKDRGNRIK